MNKKTILIIMILLSITLYACASKQVNTTQPSQNNSKSAIGTQNSNNSQNDSAQKPSNNTTNPQLNTSSSNDYSIYTGTWMPKSNVIKDSPFGIGIDIQINKDGSVQGCIFESSTNFGHLAQAKLKGDIENNKLSCNFDGDGWGHNGTVELEFQGDTIILSVKDVHSDSNVNNDWGISKGTFTLLNMNSQIHRTISDLRNGGWSDVQGQCFDVNLNSHGKLKFISEFNPYVDYHFYLADAQGNIEYKFPDSNPSGGNTYDANAPGAASGEVFNLSAISFQDINNDRLKDVVILFNSKDSNTNITKSKCQVYIQKSNGTFVIDNNLDNRLNQQNFKDMKSILNYIKR